MASRLETITVGGSPMQIYLATPDGKGPHPAVVVMFHRTGIDAFTKDRVDRLAAAGFAAAAPDLFHRMPGGVDNPEALSLLRDLDVLADVNATAEHLRAGVAKEDSVAILGHCMGGRAAFVGASSTPHFRAAVVFYSGNMFKPWGEGVPTAFERLPGLKCPVIGFFGNDDKNPSPDDVSKIDSELSRLGVPHEFHRYDGAAHAFQNFVRPEQHRPQQSDDAWAKALAFLHRELDR